MSATSCACLCSVPSPDVGSSCIVFLQNTQEFQTSSSAIEIILPSCASELLQKCWAIEDTLLLPVVFPIFVFCHMTIGNHIFLNDLKKKKHYIFFLLPSISCSPDIIQVFYCKTYYTIIGIHWQVPCVPILDRETWPGRKRQQILRVLVALSLL